MEFDIIDLTEEELKKLTNVQMQLLRTAQKKKNELARKSGQDLEMFIRLAHTNGMRDSSLIEHKRAELDEGLAYEIGIIAEQLKYSTSRCPTAAVATRMRDILLTIPFPIRTGTISCAIIIWR